MKSFFSNLKNKLTFTPKNMNLSTPSAVIAGSVLISLSLIANGLIISHGNGNSLGVSAVEKPSNMFAGKSIDGKDYVLGDENADVAVIEYSDPECPFCVQLSPTIKQIQEKYAGKIAFVYRHFPLTQIHPHAFDESRAIACAGAGEGKTGYYKYIDALFSYKYGKQTTQLPQNGVFDLAKTAGLDISKFTQCYNTQATAQIVNDNQADGVKAGVQGTPTTFVLKKKGNGYEVIALVDGARPIEAFTAPIEEALIR